MVAMTSSGTAVVTLPADTQIVITREFDAPKHLVYRAYTEPELIERWWSGERGEVTSVDVDLRVGGTWRYVMRANEGFEVAFHGEFREIVPNERLVTTEVYEMPDDFPLAGTPEAEEGTLNIDHLHGGGRAHHPHDGHGVPHQGGARRDHRLRHGRRDAGGDGPSRAGGRLARLGRHGSTVSGPPGTTSPVARRLLSFRP